MEAPAFTLFFFANPHMKTQSTSPSINELRLRCTVKITLGLALTKSVFLRANLLSNQISIIKHFLLQMHRSRSHKHQSCGFRFFLRTPRYLAFSTLSTTTILVCRAETHYFYIQFIFSRVIKSNKYF